MKLLPPYKAAVQYCMDGRADPKEIEAVEKHRRQWRATLVSNNMVCGTNPAYIVAGTGHKKRTDLPTSTTWYAYTLWGSLQTGT